MSLKLPSQIGGLLSFSFVSLGPQKVGFVGGFWTRKKEYFPNDTDKRSGIPDSYETPERYFNINPQKLVLRHNINSCS